MNKTIAVIVTFNPSEELIANVVAIRGQVDQLVIVDNCSAPAGREIVRRAVECTDSTCVFNSENLGIARALNQGAQFAEQENARWLATFDQDSRPSSSMLRKMHEAISQCVDSREVGVAAPFYINPITGLPLLRARRRSSASQRLVQVRSVMTSGNLVRLSAWRAVGGFDESFFIDYVDHDFCLRVRRKGFVIIQLLDAPLQHQLGGLSSRNLGFISITASHHNSVRRYYVTRNRMLTWRRHMTFDPAWVVHDVFRFFSELIKILLVENDVLNKLRAILRGLVDAAKRRTGKQS
jgi:rhamnosyltransferase